MGGAARSGYAGCGEGAGAGLARRAPGRYRSPSMTVRGTRPFGSREAKGMFGAIFRHLRARRGLRRAVLGAAALTVLAGAAWCFRGTFLHRAVAQYIGRGAV